MEQATTIFERGQPVDVDIWDDSELIKAYDEAVQEYLVQFLIHDPQAAATKKSTVCVGKETSPSISSPAAIFPSPQRKRPLPEAKKKVGVKKKIATPSKAGASAATVNTLAHLDASPLPASTPSYNSAYSYYPYQSPWSRPPGTFPSPSFPALPAAHYPPMTSPTLPPLPTNDDALAQLLLAWYYVGYYTGRYQAHVRIGDSLNIMSTKDHALIHEEVL